MSEWIKWEGGERPVPMDKLVEVRYRRNAAWAMSPAFPDFTRHLNGLQWDHQGRVDDIVAYRIISAKTEEVLPNAHYQVNFDKPEPDLVVLRLECMKMAVKAIETGARPNSPQSLADAFLAYVLNGTVDKR